jgi:hypothetical protein
MISAGLCLHVFAFHPEHHSLEPRAAEHARRGFAALRGLWETATAGWVADPRFRVDATFPRNGDGRLHGDDRTELLALACRSADQPYPCAVLAEAGDAVVLTLCLSDNQPGDADKWRQAWNDWQALTQRWRDAWKNDATPTDARADSPEKTMIGVAVILFGELSQEEQSPAALAMLDEKARELGDYRGDFLAQPHTREERHGGQADRLRYRRVKPARGLQDTFTLLRLHAPEVAAATVQGDPVRDANPLDASKPLDARSVFLPLVLLVGEYTSRLPPFTQYLLDSAKYRWYEREVQEAKRKMADEFRQFETLQRTVKRRSQEATLAKMLRAAIREGKDARQVEADSARLAKIEADIADRPEDEMDDLLTACMESHSNIRAHLIDLVHFEANLKISLRNLGLFHVPAATPNLFDHDQAQAKEAITHAENVLRSGEKLVEQAEGILDDYQALVARQRLKAEEAVSKSLEHLQIFVAGFTVFELVRNGFQIATWLALPLCFAAALLGTWGALWYVKGVRPTWKNAKPYAVVLLLLAATLAAAAAIKAIASPPDSPPADTKKGTPP